MRVGSPKPAQRWVFSHQPVTVAVHLTHKRPSTGSGGSQGSASHPPEMKMERRNSEGKEFRWQPPQLPSEPASFKEGQVVTVGKLQLRVGLAIGEGAYARVFGAIGVETQEEVAIKEMRCGHGAGILPDASLQRAIYEVKVMRLLTEASEGEELRVPKLLDHQFWDLPAEPGAFLCRVAMTRRRGQALISWLEERAACAEVPDGTSSSYCLCFLRAAHSARELLCQLAPTFAKLNGIAMHRDVNARNILVFCPNSALEGGAAPKDTSSLEFTLLDFGSSLDLKAWSSSSGEGSWAVENPTGDARYWGPASWLRFLHGPHVMEGGLRQQYSLGLDAFALAICTLEVIAKLHSNWRLPKEAAMSDEVEVELMESIDQFHRAWSRYWTFAVSCFERLAEYSQMVCFGEQQKATQLWEDLSSQDIPSSLQTLLHALCRDLVSLAFRCRSMTDRQWSQAGDVFEVLRDMLHEDVTLEWMDVSRLSRLSGHVPIPMPAMQHPSPLGETKRSEPSNSPVAHRRSLAEAASMAFSAVTASLFWENGTEEPVPRDEEPDPAGAAPVESHSACLGAEGATDEAVSVPEAKEPEPKMSLMCSQAEPEEQHATQDDHSSKHQEHEVCTPPVAQSNSTVSEDPQAETVQTATSATSESSHEVESGAPQVQPPAPAAAQHVPSGPSAGALHFPGAGTRAVTPRRVAVRVIRTGSPMGPAPPVLSYPGVPEKGWCRTPPPGPVAFVRFHPPTILEGMSAHAHAHADEMQAAKTMQAQVPTKLSKEVRDVSEGWQFRQSFPSQDTGALRFYPHTQRHQL